MTMSTRLVALASVLALFAAPPAALAEDPSVLAVSVDVEQATYAWDEALAEGVRGVVTVTQDGLPVEGASVVVSIQRTQWVSNVARDAYVFGQTGADGTFAFEVPTEFEVVGEYVAAAEGIAAGAWSTGSDAYAVGL